MLVAPQHRSRRIKVSTGLGLNFGDVRLVITIQNSEYEMKGDGRFSVMGGLIYEWSGDTTSSGQIGKSGPRPSLIHPELFGW